MDKKSLLFKGKKVFYKSPQNLADKLKIKLVQATNLIQGNNYIRYASDDKGDIIKYDIRESPLVLRPFTDRISNTKFLGDNTKIMRNSIKINSQLNQNQPVNLSITIKFTLEISIDEEERDISFTDNIKPSDITKEYILKQIQDRFNINVLYNLKRVDDVYATSEYMGKTLQWDGMKLYDGYKSKPPCIKHIFNEVIEYKKWNDCVIDFLDDRFGKKKPKKMDYSNVRSVNDIKQFCIENDMSMRCYDIRGTLREYNDKKNKNSLPMINFIAYNNHLYPIKNKLLKKTPKPRNYEVEIVNNAQDKFIEYYKKGVVPSNVRLSKDIVNTFFVDGKQYLENTEYIDCKRVLKLFGLHDKIEPHTNFSNVYKLLERFYNLNGDMVCLESFIPDNHKFIKGGFNYFNRELYLKNKNNITTIDKNKFYPYVLSNLEYLLQTDIRTDTHTYYDDLYEYELDIIDEYLYIVEPKISSILIPNNNIYWGKLLNKAKQEGLQFIIKESIETKVNENIYKKMVNALYHNLKDNKVDKNIFKQMMVRMIGMFECNSMNSQYKTFVKLVNEDEKNRTNGYIQKIKDTDLYVVSEVSGSTDIYNRKPIGIQIKDQSRIDLYEKMKKLKLNSKNIIQIKTDSISFIKTGIKYDKSLLNDYQLEAWKEEKFKPLDQDITPINYTLSFMSNNDNNNTICACYAGAGKTYKILNKILPKLDDYIVLTPANSCLKEYRLKNINCAVIQKYGLQNKIPYEKTIIVDEIGMVGKKGWDLLIKCYLLGKNIMCYGDFKQLPPVKDKKFNQELFMNYLFNNKEQLTTNYRNNFSREYYDELIDMGNNITHFPEIVKKYNTPWEEAETIIAFRNDTRIEYNAKKCEQLGIKSKLDIGCKLICKTNIYKDFYNNFKYIVVGEDKDNKKNMILKNENDDLQSIAKSRINTLYFDYGYALTLYGVQGQSLDSFHFTLEDLILLNGERLYTLISRLKQKKTFKKSLDKNEETIIEEKKVIIEQPKIVNKIKFKVRQKRINEYFI